MGNVKPIPDTRRGVTPYLIVHDGAAAIDFYQRAFGAELGERMDGPGGKVMHAEMTIGEAPFMLASEFPEMGHRSPKSLGGTPVGLLVYVEDVDARVKQATAAGATIEQPLKDQFYGDRSATLVDPFGHKWTIATHIEDVPPDEMRRRVEAMMKQRS